MIASKCLEVRNNHSYAPFFISGYSYLPKIYTFLIYSSIFLYLDSSARIKNNIALKFPSSIDNSSGVYVSPTLYIVFKLHRICFPPDSIKFCIQWLNLYKHSSFVTIGPWLILANELICSIRYSLGFAFKSTPAIIFFSYWIRHKLSQSFDIFS